MCIACGMPMTQIGDYPHYDITKNYCKLCAHADGSMQSFEEKLKDLTLRYIQSHQMPPELAKETATIILRKLPAWKRKW